MKYVMDIIFKNRQTKNIVILYLISITFWLSLVIYRECYKKDIKILRNDVISGCNGWCIGHFIHYLFLGYCAPDYWKELILIGIAFEIIEIPLNNMSRYIDSKLIEDTITNSLGVIAGYIIYLMFPINVTLMSYLT